MKPLLRPSPRRVRAPRPTGSGRAVAAFAAAWALSAAAWGQQGSAAWPVVPNAPATTAWPTLEAHLRGAPTDPGPGRFPVQTPRSAPRAIQNATPVVTAATGDRPTPQLGWVQPSQLGWRGYSAPWLRLTPTPPAVGGQPLQPAVSARAAARQTTGPINSHPPSPGTGAEHPEPWNLGARTGWGGTPPAEVRFGIRILPGYLDPTDPPPVGRPLRWRYVQAELSALFGDFTGFGLSAAVPLDAHWYGRLGLRFGDLFSEELDTDQCELTVGYRWPQPAFELWGEAYAELGVRVGEVEDEDATGPRLEIGHRSRIAEPLELQVAVGLDASLPDALHAEELYISSQVEWAIAPDVALRFESELADASVFRFVLRHYF